LAAKAENQDHGDHENLGTDKLKRNIVDPRIEALERSRGFAFDKGIDLIDDEHR
jgi:hypothetical protein